MFNKNNLTVVTNYLQLSSIVKPFLYTSSRLS